MNEELCMPNPIEAAREAGERVREAGEKAAEWASEKWEEVGICAVMKQL